MRRFLWVAVLPALFAVTHAADRLRYDSAHHFTFEAPASWERIPDATLQSYAKEIARRAKKRSQWLCAYQLKTASTYFEYPYALVKWEPGSPLALWNKNADDLRKSEASVTKKGLPGFSDLINHLELGKSVMDRKRRCLVQRLLINNRDLGDIKGLAFHFLGSEGVAMVAFYALAKDYKKYEPAFLKIAESFAFKEGYRFVPPKASQVSGDEPKSLKDLERDYALAMHELRYRIDDAILAVSIAAEHGASEAELMSLSRRKGVEGASARVRLLAAATAILNMGEELPIPRATSCTTDEVVVWAQAAVIDQVSDKITEKTKAMPVPQGLRVRFRMRCLSREVLYWGHPSWYSRSWYSEEGRATTFTIVPSDSDHGSFEVAASIGRKRSVPIRVNFGVEKGRSAPNTIAVYYNRHTGSVIVRAVRRD